MHAILQIFVLQKKKMLMKMSLEYYATIEWNYKLAVECFI